MQTSGGVNTHTPTPTHTSRPLLPAVLVVYHAHALQPLLEVELALRRWTAHGLLYLDLFVFYVVAVPHFLVQGLFVLFYSHRRLHLLLLLTLNDPPRLDDGLDCPSTLPNPLVKPILIFKFLELPFIFGGEAFVVFFVFEFPC
jgi:hypothetical protein